MQFRLTRNIILYLLYIFHLSHSVYYIQVNTFIIEGIAVGLMMQCTVGHRGTEPGEYDA